MGLIGIEEHWNSLDIARALDRLPDDQRDQSTAFNDMGDNRERLEDLGDGRIAAMDAQGVDVQVIALAPPATQALPGPEALRLSRQANDLAAEAVRRHPGRLRAMATLPLSDPGAAAEELERAAGLGLVGAMVYGRSGDVPLDDPRFDDVFAAAEAGLHPLFLHPQIAPGAGRAASYGGFDPTTGLLLSTAGWGWHIEAAVAALRLVVRGTFDRHPDLQLVLGHWGQLLMFWQDRVDSLAGVAHLDRAVSDYLRSNVHVTCSGMLSPALLHHVLEVTTVDRLLFSTDYPFQRPSRSDIEAFLSEFASDGDRELFTSGNARRLFRITGQDPGR